MAGPQISQTNLSASSIEERGRVAVWLETASFAPIDVMYKDRKVNGILRCNDAERNAKLESLLAAMGLERDNFTIGIIRVKGPDTFPTYSESVSTKLVPLRLLDDDPKLSGQKLDFTKVTEYKGQIFISPAVDLLLLVPRTVSHT